MSAGTVLIVEPNPGILIVARNVLARAGFQVLAAHDAAEGVALSRRIGPDVILVDSKQANPKVLEALAAVRPEGVPIILTVQKGRDAITLEAIDMEQTIEVAEFVEKPFLPERLLSSVERVIERWAEYTEPVATDRLANLRNDLAASFEGESTDRFPFASLLQTDISDDNDETKINPVIPPLLAERARRFKAFLDKEGVKLSEGDFRVCVRALEQLLAGVEDDSVPSPHGMLASRGYIDRMPIDQILQLACTVEPPARCRLENDGTTIEIFYRGSDVVFARGNNLPEGFTLGRLLVALGRVDQRIVDRTLEAKASPGFLGQRLIAAGAIAPDDLTGALLRQTEELVYEAIAWKTGRFSIYARSPHPREATEAGISTHVHHLLLEGMRRLDEWQRMMGEVGDFGTVLSRLEPLEPAILEALRPEDRRLLEHVDGRRTIRELLLSARRPTFHAFRTLYNLAGQRLIIRASA
jgi:DNA-binding response OmpR family regulator